VFQVFRIDWFLVVLAFEFWTAAWLVAFEPEIRRWWRRRMMMRRWHTRHLPRRRGQDRAA
jgi:hypothetical protein